LRGTSSLSEQARSSDAVVQGELLSNAQFNEGFFAINGPSYRLKDKLGSRSTPVLDDQQ
jgi:hypothetical protein